MSRDDVLGGAHLSALALIFLAACANSTPSPSESISDISTETVHVSPSGDDAAAGTIELPFRTISHAIGVPQVGNIVLAEGTYPEPELVLSRRVALTGPENNGARIEGQLRISASGVRVSHLGVSRGVVVSLAKDVSLDALSITPGNLEDALAISSSEAKLSGLEITCGTETCIQATTSQVSIVDTKLNAMSGSKRGLRVETSSVTAERLSVEGTTLNQIIGLGGASLKLTEIRLVNAGGTALAALKGAEIDGDKISIEGADGGAVLVQASRVILRNLSTDKSSGSPVAIAGGELQLIDPKIAATSAAGITINSHFDHDPKVRISGGTIEHISQPAVLLGQGELTIEKTVFRGVGKAKDDEGDSIIANGPSSFLRFLSGRIESPGGFGITLTRDASATITATISNPRIGGVFVEDVAAGSVAISGTVIEKCGSGTGIVVQDAIDVSIRSTTVTGCSEAGLLAGQTAVVSVSRSQFAKNAQYGIAAFGGATITVEGSRASGSRWATFATCGDGASIDDAGSNKFSGQTTVCP